MSLFTPKFCINLELIITLVVAKIFFLTLRQSVLFIAPVTLFFSCYSIVFLLFCGILILELPHDKTNKVACAPSEDSDQPGHPPSLIRVFAVRMKKQWVISYPLSALRRLWSDWVDAQADLSLRWVHIILLVLSCCGSTVVTLYFCY